MSKPIKVVVPAAPAKQPKAAFAWEAVLADELNIPYSQDVKKFFDGWTTADNSKASNNPFNITVDYTGTANGKLAGNTAGVLNFPTPLDGLKATAQFILTRTPNIAHHLAAGDFQAAASAIQQSRWAGDSQTYGAAVYRNFQNGSYTPGNNTPTTLSPKDKAQVGAQTAALADEAKASNASYVAASTDLAAVKAQAKVTAHISDPWITVVKKAGRVTGFGEAYGFQPPANVLTQGGVPLTKSEYSYYWNANYADVFQQFAGRPATPAEIAQTLENGSSVYALKKQLAAKPSFQTSPVFQQKGAAVQQYVKQALGAVPAGFVQQALANDWDQAEIDAQLRKLPTYTDSPQFKDLQGPIQSVYKQVYGNTVSPEANQWIRQAALNGWSQDTAAAALRNDPAYNYSPEYQAKAVSFLDAMGLFIGARPVATVAKPGPLATAAARSTTGGPPLNLQAGLGGT